MYEIIIPCYKINEKDFTTAISSINIQKIKPSRIIIIIDGLDIDFIIVNKIIKNYKLNFIIIDIKR